MNQTTVYQNLSNHIEASSFDFSSQSETSSFDLSCQYSEVVYIDDTNPDEILLIADIGNENNNGVQDEVHQPASLDEHNNSIISRAFRIVNNNINTGESQHVGENISTCMDEDNTCSIPSTSASEELDFHTVDCSNDHSPKISHSPLQPTTSLSPSKNVKVIQLEDKSPKG